MLVQCDLAYLQVPIHYANFQLEVDPRPVPVPAGAEQLEEQPQEQRQEQQEGLEVDVDVEVDWEVPEVPEPADFGDDLHSPDKFLKVTSAEATAVDVIDGGETRISRLFQAQVIRRGSGPNRVVECPFWAVVQGKAGVQPWVVSVVPFVQVRPPSTHNRLLLCSIDALGQLQRWKHCEWSDVRAIAPAPHLKEAAQAFLLRFQKQLVGRGTKGEKGGRAGSDASGDPSLRSKGRTEQQARGSRRPRPTTTPQEAAQAAQAAEAAGDGGGAWEKAEILRLEAGNKLLREQLKAVEAARKTAQEALTGERALWERREKGWEKQRVELQQQLTATAQVRAVGGGAEGGADPDHVQHVPYLQAAAVELHSALSAQRHVAINMGVKEATLTELKGLLDKHPVAHLLDPKRRRAEEGEGSQSQGSKRSRK